MRNYYFFSLTIFSMITMAKGIAQIESIDSRSQNLNSKNQILQHGEEFPDPYCSMEFMDGVEPITRVIMGSIDNSSNPAVNDSPEVEDFTHIVTDVYTGARHEVRVEANTNGDYLNAVYAYIDWNQNGIFEENELYPLGFIKNSSGIDGKQAFNTILVPDDALEGTTRMRIVKRWNDGAFPACGEGNLGQAEDYSLNILHSDGPCSVNYSGSFTNGTGNIQEVIYADDFEVAPNTKMEINQISLRIYGNISSADIMILKDNNGTPGSIVETYSRLEPTSQTYIDTQSGYNTYQNIFDFASPTIVLGGVSGNRYWIGVRTYEGTEGDSNLWEIADSNTNFPSHYSTDGINWTENSSGFDLAFIINGNCEPNSAYDGCTQFFEPSGTVGIAMAIDFVESNDYRVANDFIVEPNSRLTLNELKIWISTDGLPTSFQVSFYEDLNVGVGDQIGETYEDLIMEYYPDGIIGWSTRWAVNLTFPEPVVFENDSNEEIHYWIGLSAENDPNGERLYWGASPYENNSSHPSWRSNDGGETWTEFENRRNGMKAEGMMAIYATCDDLLNTSSFEENNFSFYPNPVQNTLNILSDNEINSVTIFNLHGQLILHRQNYSKQIDLSHIKTGMYIAKIIFEDGVVQTIKLLKD